MVASLRSTEQIHHCAEQHQFFAAVGRDEYAITSATLDGAGAAPRKHVNAQQGLRATLMHTFVRSISVGLCQAIVYSKRRLV